MELEFKGTKGEWKITEEFQIRNEEGLSIADVWWATEPYHTTLLEKNEGEANLKLIAAAPDLLEALQYTLEQLKGLDCNNPTERMIIKKCEKAIEKALKK